MEIESIIGAGILGSLKYNESQDVWAIELGQWLGSFAIAFSREHLLGGEEVVSKRPIIIQAIDQCLSRHDIPQSISVILASNDNDAARTAYVLHNMVRSLKGTAALALVLIGECAMGMRSDSDRNGAKSTLQAYLRDIEHYCSELEIATEALEKIIFRQQEDGLTATGINRLLVKLSKPLSVLIMSAEPRNASILRLAEERRELEDALRRTRFRDSLNLYDVASCRVRDITSALDRYSPNILHFSGHGDNSALFFENDKGEAKAVEKAALASLLGTQRNLKLVILNACYSENQAQAIADVAGCVIGMEGSLLDEDSISFSREFYTALGHGRTFEDAFDRAKSAIGLTSTLKLHLLKRSS